jgi:hypothetical protein
VEGLDGTHSSLPMLVAEIVTDCVCLSARAEQGAEVALSLDVLEREQQHDAEHHHGLSHPLVVSSPASTPLHEEDEVGNVVGHLRSGGRSAIFEVQHSVVELPGHTNDHVVEVAAWGERYGLKCLPLGTSKP